jgi:hypothetical protein
MIRALTLVIEIVFVSLPYLLTSLLPSIDFAGYSFDVVFLFKIEYGKY